MAFWVHLLCATVLVVCLGQRPLKVRYFGASQGFAKTSSTFVFNYYNFLSFGGSFAFSRFTLRPLRLEFETSFYHLCLKRTRSSIFGSILLSILTQIKSTLLVKYNGTVMRLKPCEMKIEGAW